MFFRTGNLVVTFTDKLCVTDVLGSEGALYSVGDVS